jgi:hypothetical protein
MQANSTPSTPPKVITPSAAHRRQMLWQVWFPLAVSLLAVLFLAAIAILAAVADSPLVAKWGSISAVIVIFPWLIVGIFVFALVALLVYGMFYLLKNMPGWMLQGQLFLLHLALIIRRIADAATKPVMSVHAFSARVSALWRKLAGTSR